MATPQALVMEAQAKDRSSRNSTPRLSSKRESRQPPASPLASGVGSASAGMAAVQLRPSSSAVALRCPELGDFSEARHPSKSRQSSAVNSPFGVGPTRMQAQVSSRSSQAGSSARSGKDVPPLSIPGLPRDSQYLPDCKLALAADSTLPTGIGARPRRLQPIDARAEARRPPSSSLGSVGKSMVHKTKSQPSLSMLPSLAAMSAAAADDDDGDDDTNWRQNMRAAIKGRSAAPRQLATSASAPSLRQSSGSRAASLPSLALSQGEVYRSRWQESSSELLRSAGQAKQRGQDSIQLVSSLYENEPRHFKTTTAKAGANAHASACWEDLISFLELHGLSGAYALGFSAFGVEDLSQLLTLDDTKLSSLLESCQMDAMDEIMLLGAIKHARAW
eukprot:TRINITY_DN37565_c0_g1_i1.p1 TRINITY_DN37565_c0_g1~~TRINITY_DN37565_c0_g1_i1.p1  ORF type:complete len:390 (+),score=45.10 TRINITY_DN37565_c0_g1_i1:112-1281(+)